MRYMLICGLLAAGLVLGLPACSLFRHHGGREQPVTLSQVPTPTRAAIERLTAGGKIEKLEMEHEGDTVLYDVEAQVAGKHVEYDIDSTGKILTSGEDVSYQSLPPIVRAAAEKYFGSSRGLQAFKEMERGQTFYEVMGKKDGAPRELKLTEGGQIVGDEGEDG